MEKLGDAWITTYVQFPNVVLASRCSILVCGTLSMFASFFWSTDASSTHNFKTKRHSYKAASTGILRGILMCILRIPLHWVVLRIFENLPVGRSGPYFRVL